MVESLFLSPFFDNFTDYQVMIEYLHNKVSEQVEKGRPTISSSSDSYKDFLSDRTIPVHGTEWRKVFDEFSQMFQNAVIWQSPGAMINVTPPANMPSIIASFYTALFNPNFATDESSGFLMATELIVIRYLSQLVNWNKQSYSGLFTFGGKGTNLYALKMGLKKATPDINLTGIHAYQYVVFTNEKSHPCHIEAAEWMGIGKMHVSVLPTTESGQVDLKELENQMRDAVKADKKIACIYLNGGNTNEGYIDPIRKVVSLRDKIVSDYHLDYHPHIHVDAVIGWVWLFFGYYNFERNALGMSESESRKIQSIVSKITEIEYADSFGADFHKTGFCPYVSSAFVVKNRRLLEESWHCHYSDKEEMKYGEYTPFEYSLELTRSSLGPVSAFISLEMLGIEGYQKLIYQLFHSGEQIRMIISKDSEFEVINQDTEGFATLFVVKRPGEFRSYHEMLRQNDEVLEDFIDYNFQFYLFLQKAYEMKKINSRITFSKSYRPFGAKRKTGALKIYQMSPIVSLSEWHMYIQALLDMKKAFNSSGERLMDSINRPKDLVYRDEDTFCNEDS